MDTETTGLAGGTGTVVFLLGFGKVEGDTLRICQYLLTGFMGEPALLTHAQALMRDVTTFVTYNGKSFDHPLLAARYRLAGLVDPFAQCAKYYEHNERDFSRALQLTQRLLAVDQRDESDMVIESIACFESLNVRSLRAWMPA